MDWDSIEEFYKVLNIDSASDVLVLYIAMIMKAQCMGEYQFSEFKAGCLKLECDTVRRWQASLPKLRK